MSPPAVYAVKGSLSRFAGRAANDWRDRSFAAVPTDSVQTVDVTRHDGRYTIERADSAQWTVNDNPADSSSVMRVIGALRAMEASGFPTVAQHDSITFETPYRRLTVRGLDGALRLALIFDSTAAGTWVRHDSGGPIYRFDRWRIDALMPTDSTLRVR